LPRRLVAEAAGTFFLTLVAAGAEVVAVVSKGELGSAAKVVAPGVVVMALVYSMGDVSGAHFNPAVTLAFAIRGVFRWSCVAPYWGVQLVAATTAAIALRAVFGDVANLGAPVAHIATRKALPVEAALTLLLILVILNTATRARVVGPNAAIAVGGTIALCGLVGGPISGAAMNPARAFGPELIAGHWTGAWVYAAGPAIGVLLAVALTAILHPVTNKEEVDAAQGEHVDQPEDHRARRVAL
jgi:aquaporin Z